MWVIEHYTQGRCAEMTDIEHLVCPPASIILSICQRKIALKNQHLCVAADGIIEQHLGTVGPHKIATKYLPIPIYIVHRLVVSDMQIGIKT